MVFAFFWGISARAAQVTIDDTVHTTAASHLGGSPRTVFINQNTGYAFYRDSTGACVYSKTTDGGATWGAAVTVDSQTDCISIAVWYDQWTPGDTGTRIHIATIDTSVDDIWYSSFNTANDTFDNTIFNISDNAAYGGTLTAGTNYVSITKSTTGALYAATLDGSDSIVMQCTANCTTDANWVENSPTFTLGNDPPILLPQASGAVMLLQWDISADDLQHKIFNGTSWDANWTTIEANAADNTTYDAAFGAAIDPSTFDVYLAAADDIATLGGSDDDIKVWRYSAGAWSARTDVVTDSACAGVSNCGITGAKIARDPNTDYLYVLYSAQSTPGTAASANVYWKYSTDGGSTWSAEFGPVYSTNDDIYGVRLSLMGSSTERIYATWYAATPDDLFGRPIAPKTFEQSAYRFFANTDSTDVGSPLAAQNNGAILSSSGQAFRLRMLLHIGVSDLFGNEGVFKIQFSQRGADGQCDSAFNGENYQDITTSTLIAFYDNSTPADGAVLIANADDPTHNGHTIVNQTYEELNNATNSQGAINVGQDGKWDFSLYDNGAVGGTTYCFRIVKASGSSLLETYSVIPEITIASAPYLTQRGFIFENDDGVNVNVNTTSTAENTTLTMEKGERAVFRVQVENSGDQATTTNFYLQWATTTDSCVPSLSWQQLNATSEVSWSLGLSGGSGDALTSSKISGGQGVFVNGRWFEGADNTGSFDFSTSTYTEFGFMIHTANALASTTYCLRLTQNGSFLNEYQNFGSLFITSTPTKKFSKEAVFTLPATTTDLTYYLDNRGYQSLASDDDIRDIIASSSSIPIFLFANQNSTNTDAIVITWQGQSSVSPASNPVYLQIWNGASWVDIDSNNSAGADTDFEFSDWKTGSQYYDAENWVYLRVYQASGTQTLRTDYINISFASPITISGYVFTDEGLTTSTAGSIISLAIEGELIASTTASTTNGFYSFSVLPSATGTPITVFVDQTTGESGGAITRYQGSGDLSNFNIYVNYVILRHEDSGPITNQDIGHFDSEDPGGANAPFTVSSGPSYVLAVEAGHTLYIAPDKTYEPAWNVSTPYLKVANNATLSAGNTTIIIEDSGNSFLVNGNFQSATSTIIFEGTSNTNIPSLTYYNLTINPASSTPTFTFSSGSLTINNNFLATTSESAQATIDATAVSNMSVGNDFSVSQNQSFLAPSSLSVAGDWTNNGIFSHQNGTVIFNGATQQAVSGNLNASSSFNVLVFTNNSGSDNPFQPSIVLNASTTAATSTITTGSVRVQFQAGATFEFNNVAWNGQASTTRIFFRSSASGTQWYLTVNNPTPVSYVNVQDSNASSTSGGIDAENGTNYDAGNNVNWFIDAPTVATENATNIKMKSATLNATVDLGDRSQVTLLFYWREVGTTTWSTTTLQTATSSGIYSQNIAGLAASTTYEFYGEIQWVEKTAQGNTLQFATMPLTLSGTVTISGNPAEGAKVWVVRDSDMSFVGWDTTNASGTYAVILPEDNTVYLVAVDYYDSANDKYYSSAKGIMFVGE